MPPKSDAVRLRHMLEAANEASAFTQGMDAEAFAGNRIVQLAVVRSIEIIGEAATNLSKGFQQTHPEIPWPQIISMRNRLIHAYFDIDVELVWKTTIDVLPSFIKIIEQYLREEGPTLFED